MAESVSLRPIEEADLPVLARFLVDPSATGEFQWFGFRVRNARELERRWHEDGLIGEPGSYLVVALEDGSCAGWVDWLARGMFGHFEIGIALFEEHRSRGIGAEAQRQLVDYLFSTTTTHRLQAGTEVGNLAEQHALERVGFTREGLQRDYVFRAGSWRDCFLYAILRPDWRGGAKRT